MKLSVDITDSSCDLDSLSRSKLFSSYSAGNSFLFFKRVWNVRLSDRCCFIVNFLAWEKPMQLFSIFLFYSVKISVFDMINLKYITVYMDGNIYVNQF